MHVLIDTREPFDARWLAYDGPRDPRADAEGLILSLAAYDQGRRPEPSSKAQAARSASPAIGR